MKKIFISIIILAITVTAYWLISPIWRVKQVNDTVPSSALNTNVGENTKPKILSGAFVKSAHDVSGTASVIDTGSEKILRFENFETINGPDLRIYLATDSTAREYIDLGVIKGTKGNINYTIRQTDCLPACDREALT